MYSQFWCIHDILGLLLCQGDSSLGFFKTILCTRYVVIWVSLSNHLSSILYIEVFLVPLASCLLYFQSTCYCEQCRLVWQQSGVGQLSGGRRGSSCPQSSCPPQLLPTSPFQPPDRAPPTTHQCPPGAPTNFKPGTVPGTRATDKTVRLNTAADDFLWNERLVY